ncbi:hypothetical protein C8A00DRAFT_36389 [Chaetomidium leptoderma]|uniref:MYND-type domain-containing protein n=1 Tax=Chaetomidium leptoderma TaxID=669021 RepID=A0AAN6ZW23_9PEZI|nr:hypothetical protein C8A00DRAFT_36389 [Chaetomidium leptoderma]
MPLPDFTTPNIFPPFSALPLTTQDDNPPPNPTTTPSHYLLAEITENMTLTKPTLILTDLTASTFALIFHSRPASGPDTLDFAKLGYKKGATLVIPDARRTPGKSEGKQGFVAVTREQERGVRVVPAGLKNVVGVMERLAERDGVVGHDGDDDDDDDGEEEVQGGRRKKGCENCGASGEGEKRDGGGGGGKGKLMKCTGCGEVEYCCKDCQVKGWSEGGHKADCKVIKAIRAIWP